MKQAKNIFITGGAGLIGFTLAKELLKKGHNVAIFDLKEQLLRNEDKIDKLSRIYPNNLKIFPGTLMDKYAVVEAVTGYGVVIHLAAMLGVKRTEDNKLQCLNVNVNGTENILNACLQNDRTHFIFGSSSEVYGEPIYNPVNEECITQGKTVYAISKLAGEELVKGFAQLYKNINFTIIRFFNTYGEGQVAQFVLSKFISRVINAKPPLVYGDGGQMRTFCHAKDASQAINLIIENQISRNKIYNVGNMKEKYTLLEAANLVINTLKKSPELKPKLITFDESDRVREREIFQRICDCSLIMKELNYRPQISLREGILAISKTKIMQDWVS